MFHRTHSLSIPAIGLTLTGITGSASAQTASYRREAGALPCVDLQRLSVVQDAQGFSIADANARKPAPPVIAKVPLGAHLTLDRALFAEAASLKETADAPRR